MAKKKKITEEQIIECLEANMNYHDIAKQYGMNHQSVYQRIKRMKEEGRFPEGGVKPVFYKMDTVVRKKDRKWFRIIEINDDMEFILKTCKVFVLESYL